MTARARPELAACVELIEQLCACMRALAAHGIEHEDVLESASACRRAIASAQPPFALRFLSDCVLRDREPLPLDLGAFRRSQILARALYQQLTPQLSFAELPKLEVIVKLAKLFVEATQGNHRSILPRLPGITMDKLCVVDPTGDGHDETDVDRVLRAQLYFATTHIEALHADAMRTSVWSWLEGQRAIATLERCLALGVTATARSLELAAPEWTPARRSAAMVTNVLTVLTRLRVSDVARRAAGHAMLAIAGHGLPQSSLPQAGLPQAGPSFEDAAAHALDAVHRAPMSSSVDEAAAPSPHRLRTTALLSACAGRSRPPMALARLLHATWVLEGQRIKPDGQRLSRIDLQAWLFDALGREVDEAFGRAMLAALGAYPPGAHVMSEGRLGVVVGPGKVPDRPIVLVGGALAVPDAPVAPASPLGMSPWAK